MYRHTHTHTHTRTHARRQKDVQAHAHTRTKYTILHVSTRPGTCTLTPVINREASLSMHPYRSHLLCHVTIYYTRNILIHQLQTNLLYALVMLVHGQADHVPNHQSCRRDFHHWQSPKCRIMNSLCAGITRSQDGCTQTTPQWELLSWCQWGPSEMRNSTWSKVL